MGDEEFGYCIVGADRIGVVDLVNFLVRGSNSHEFAARRSEEDDGDDEGAWGTTSSCDRRSWVIVVSVIARRIIAILGEPMEWNGVLLEMFLNLLSLNGGLVGLLRNLLAGELVVPHKGSETFISAIGHLDSRVDLYKFDCSQSMWTSGSLALMDLCIMASKLAYENANVVKNVVNNHWKMHFVGFYNCWNDYQKERSTQVFILCDKPVDADLILVSFRGTEPFDPDDWSSDFDYSWYEIPKMGKVHMGFLEALGLGTRTNVSTFQRNLQREGQNLSIAELDRAIAYYAVRNTLKRLLLHKHKNAKFVVTGHSLGGALAILFPAVLLFHEENELMERMLAVYTFGQPRVGDRELKRFMEAHVSSGPVPKYFRVVYCNDLVPRLPYDDKTFLYKHFGCCLYYDSFYNEQTVREEPNRNYFGLKYLVPEYLNAIWELIRSFSMGHIYGPDYKENWLSILLRVCGLAIPGISAHSPTNYINSIRLGSGVQMRQP